MPSERIQHRLIRAPEEPGKGSAGAGVGEERRRRSVGDGRGGEGRAWYDRGGASWQLGCEEANGLSSSSHAHLVFSDGHSSGETHIGLATGTELWPASRRAASPGKYSVRLNSD